MLKGFYKVNGFVYSLRGYDFGDNIAFYLSTSEDSAKDYIDHGITVVDEDDGTGSDMSDMVEDDSMHYSATWDDYYISVGKGFIKVDAYTRKSDSGKVFKNDVNAEFFSRLGGIIMGMISSCNNTTREDSFEKMVLNSVLKKEVKYNIEGKGTVTLNMKTLKKLEYKSNYDELELFDDDLFTERVLRNTNTQHRIKLDLSEFVIGDVTEDDSDWDFSDDENNVFSLAEIIERNPQKSYVWLEERVYHIVSDIDEVEEVCKKIWNHDGIVSFDTETTGLNITFLSRYGLGDRLVGMVFCIKPGEAWYFPVAHKKIKNICDSSNEDYIINKYFKPILEKKPILCHNGSYDWKVMHIYNIFVNLKEDTLILPKVTIWNDHRGMELNLKALTSVFLKRDSFELSDFVSGKWGKNDIKFWDLDYESVKYYACPDTDNALELLEYFKKEGYIEKYGAAKTYEIEVAFSLVIAYQEFYGHCVDVAKIDDLRKDIAGAKERSYHEMVEICGHEFNPRSNKELPHVMFEELGMPVIGKTNTGNASTDKNVRKYFLDQRNPDGSYKYPFVKALEDYLNASQLESNFTKNIDKFASDDGFMFSQVTQFLETGRVSVKEPNYQSYNDVVKHYIVPRKGYYAMDADYSSIEYRILACMAEEQGLIKRFYDPDMDYHTYQASRMFRVPYELVTKKLRSNAKGINFGIPYGMGDSKLGERLFGERTPENTLKAKKMKRLYFEGQENVEKFFIDARANGVKNLYSETFFGRRRYFDPRLKDKGSIEREAGNNRIQGTAADIYKISMVRLFSEIRNRGLAGKILISAFVHDECFLEVHKSIDPAKMLKMLRGCMMLEIQGWCPLYIGAGFGTNWYDAKKTEIPVQVQDKIANTWGDTGLDWWDGDTEKLFYWEVGEINDYKRDRVINYLKDEDNWNKVFKPVENGFAHEVLEEIEKGRHVDGIVEGLDKSTVHPCKDMIENLEEFCRVFGLMELFEKANIQKPNYDGSKEVDVTVDDTEKVEEVNPYIIVNSRLKLIGVSFLERGNNRKLYFRFDEDDPVLMKVIYGIFADNPGEIPVGTFRDGKEFNVTNMKVSTKAYQKAVAAYAKRKSQRAIRG